MVDGLKGYIQVATGLTEVTAAKAREIVSSLIAQGLSLSSRAPEVLGQVQSMADDLMTTGKDNREMLIGLIKAEVDRAVARVGFVREDELAALRRQVQALEEEVRGGRSSTSQPVGVAPEAGAPVEVGEPGDPGDVDPGDVDPQAPKPAGRKKKVVVVSEADA